MTNNSLSLPEIQIDSSRLYTILKIVFLVAAFTVVALNVLSVNALPENTTDWNYGNGTVIDLGTFNIIEKNNNTYPENYYNDQGIPNELIDDDLEESEELEDEKIHQEESKNWDNDDK